MKKITPILFSTDMVQALLAGRKHVTRRVVKNQPIVDEGSGFVFDGVKYKHMYAIHSPHLSWQDQYILDSCRYGNVEDLLFVREAWAETCDNMGIPIIAYRGGGNPVYIGRDNEVLAECTQPWSIGSYPADGRWKPSLHMLAKHARIWLQVTGVKMERVADITWEDAISEGIEKEWDGTKHWYRNYLDETKMFVSPIDSFRSLWCKINGEPSPVQQKEFGKLKTVGYIVYPFDESCAKEFEGKKTWKGKPLTVVTNPYVYAVSFDVLSANGKPENL